LLFKNGGKLYQQSENGQKHDVKYKKNLLSTDLKLKQTKIPVFGATGKLVDRLSHRHLDTDMT
jgi:hypothetical protein